MPSRITTQLKKNGLELPERVVKRDGATVEFDLGRIEKAIEGCWAGLQHEGNIPASSVHVIVDAAATTIASRHARARHSGAPYPTVEQIQDLVEVTLLSHHEVDAARSYMAYRDARATERANGRMAAAVPEHVRNAFAKDAELFNTPMQQFAYYDKYSRFNWELNRRETWSETVDRTIEHLKWEVRYHFATHPEFGNMDLESSIPLLDEEQMSTLWPELPIGDDIWERLREGILHMKVMPSMRLLAMAGAAARRNSVSIYNCSFLPQRDLDAFVESLIISFSGCGVGYSVERAPVENFPRVKRQKARRGAHPTYVVQDTSEGWADALRAGLTAWWAGEDLSFDYSQVRPAGAVLKTKGGRASGPEPLAAMLTEIRRIVLSRQGSFITTVDAHDIACNVGEAAVQGGVRRTAMIALFDWDDHEMRTCKNGPWGTWPSVRTNANNSAVWPEDISDLDVMNQMTEMMFGGAGEPGIFSRASAFNTMPQRRREISEGALLGTNPCGEIFLRPFEFCNLSQAIARSGDTESDLAEKVELATILGTLQSLSTRFPGLRPEWKANCEQERLLGVDLTAQNDCELLRFSNPDGGKLRSRLVSHAVEVNAAYAELLHINASAAITCNKPAGNSTGFIGASGSGIHKSFAPYYIRRMTVGAHTPQFRVLREAGVPMRPYAGSGANPDRWWAEFPVKAPAGSPLLRDTSAIAQCEFWLLNKENWTEHNPSCTVTYRLHEAIGLVKWVAEHKSVIGGLSFLPADDTVYPIMPFEEITEVEYNKRVAAFPEVDYSLLWLYERSDMSEASTTLSCFAGQCDI